MNWINLLLSSTAVGTLGFIAGLYTPDDKVWMGFVPIVAVTVWRVAAPMLPVDSQDGSVDSPETEMVAAIRGADSPRRIEDFEGALRGRDGSLVQTGMPVYALLEFVRLGWMDKFSFREMKGKRLWRGTLVGKTDWQAVTDALDAMGYIRKRERATTEVQACLRTLLRAVEPFPTPSGWVGWDRQTITPPPRRVEGGGER